MDLIDKKIKELYNNDKALFSEKINVHPTNFSKKLKTIENQMAKVNAFLEPLNLELEIKEKPILSNENLLYFNNVFKGKSLVSEWLLEKGYGEIDKKTNRIIINKKLYNKDLILLLKEYQNDLNKQPNKNDY